MRSNSEPKTLDPAATRASILSAATHLFSQKGMAATSTSEIASAAGVTKSLVLYHFQTKEDLWKAVLLSKSEPFFEATSAFLSDGPVADVRAIAKSKFELLRTDSDLARLMAWMSLESTSVEPRMQERIQRVRDKIHSNPCAVGIPEQIDPAMFMALLMSSIDGYFRFRQMYQVMVGKVMMTPEAEDEFFDVLMSVMFGKLGKEEATSGV